MSWHCVDPLVEGRVKFRDDLLLPVWPYEPKEDFRLVNRVLRQPLRIKYSNIKGAWLTMVLNAMARIWMSLIRETKYDSTDGFPAGCLDLNA